MTAGLEVLHINETKNKDLFHAARGAGPAFPAVVTRFYMKTLSLLPMWQSLYFFDITKFKEVLEWLIKVSSLPIFSIFPTLTPATALPNRLPNPRNRPRLVLCPPILPHPNPHGSLHLLCPLPHRRSFSLNPHPHLPPLPPLRQPKPPQPLLRTYLPSRRIRSPTSRQRRPRLPHPLRQRLPLQRPLPGTSRCRA